MHRGFTISETGFVPVVIIGDSLGMPPDLFLNIRLIDSFEGYTVVIYLECLLISFSTGDSLNLSRQFALESIYCAKKNPYDVQFMRLGV
jgi:hypothetical protein